MAYFNEYAVLGSDENGVIYFLNLDGEKIAEVGIDGCIIHAKNVWPNEFMKSDISDKYDILFLCKTKDGKWGVCDEYGFPRVDFKYKTQSALEDAMKKKKIWKDLEPMMRLKQYYFENNYENSVGRNYEKKYKQAYESFTNKLAYSKKLKIEVVDTLLTPDNRIIEAEGFMGILDTKARPLEYAGKYDYLNWNNDLNRYFGIYGNYSTYIQENGQEENPIVKQMFEEAYNHPDDSFAKIIYEEIIFVDPTNYYKQTSLSYNNLGVIANNAGNIEQAEMLFDKSYNLDKNNTVALENRNKLRDYQNDIKRQERQEKLLAALNGLSNALSEGAQAIVNTRQANETFKGGKTMNEFSAPSKRKRDKIQKHNIGQAINSRTAIRAYDGYVSNLIEMNTYRDRYDDSRRKSIQSSMKSCRERNNANADAIHISKSEWETWDGSPK